MFLTHRLNRGTPLACFLFAATLFTAASPAAAFHSCESPFGLGVPSSFMEINDWAPPNQELEACGDDVDAIGWGAWFSVVGTGNVLTATTCNEGTHVNLDTQISVFCGDCDDLVCVAGNNDDPECGVAGHSTVQWCSEQGRTYFILVHGVDDSMGMFQLDITEGDACGNPIACQQPPTGACCESDGSCTEDVTEVDCIAGGGTWHDGLACAGVTCPQPTGACCAADGTCTVTTEADCTGDWTEGDDCDPNPCTQPPTTGACCHADGTCTNGATLAVCNTTGDAWHEGEICGTEVCTTNSMIEGGVTVSTQGGVTVTASVSQTPPATPPAGFLFPVGFITLKLENLPAGGATSVKLAFDMEEGETITTYYKYGPTPEEPTPHWYEFLYDGTTGAVIEDNVVTLHFVDGQRGDADLTADGVIEDPGAAATELAIALCFDPLLSFFFRLPICGIGCGAAILAMFAGLLGMKRRRRARQRTP